MTQMEKRYAFDDQEAVDRLTALGDCWWRRHTVANEWDGNTVRLAGRKLGVSYDARLGSGIAQSSCRE